jgi:hypothetical protein
VSWGGSSWGAGRRGGVVCGRGASEAAGAGAGSEGARELGWLATRVGWGVRSKRCKSGTAGGGTWPTAGMDG